MDAVALRAVLLEPFGFGLPGTRVTAEQWPTVVAAATEHRVLGALWRGTAIETQGPPAEAIEPIRAEYYTALTRHLKYVELLRKLVGVFEREQVQWAVVKGPVLAELAYPSVDLRTYTDLDLLVHPSDLERAVQVLEAEFEGEVFERNWTFMAERQRGELQVNLPGGLFADVHWHLLIDPRLRRQIRLDTVELLRRARPVSLAGIAVPTLDPADAAIHLIVHAVLAGAHRFKWNLDVEFATRKLLADCGSNTQWATRLAATHTEAFAAVMADRMQRLLGPGAAKGWPEPHRGLWTKGLARFDASRRPEEWFGQTGSSRLLVAATRPGTVASARAVGEAAGIAAREFASNPAHRWRRRPDESALQALPEILHDDPDPHGRAKFFAMARTARR